MYLLLVENSYISSREIKSLLHKNEIKCEIVNCSTSEALLDLAEKIAPDLVIIDFDLFVDDSADIVYKLRRFSPGAYILAFVDPDHYNRLHRAIDNGIDNYMVKPLQRDDVLLRIKMGLQNKSSLDSARTVEQKFVVDPLEQAPEAPQETDAESKKMFEDLADYFGKQLQIESGQPDKLDEFDKSESASESEEPFAPAENTELMIEPDVEEEVETRALEAEDRGLNVTELSPRTESDFTWPGTGDYRSGFTADPAEPEATQELAAHAETEDQTLFGTSYEPDISDFFTTKEDDSDTETRDYGLIDEAFSLVDDLKELEEVKPANENDVVKDEVHSETDPVTDFPYLDDLFSREPLTDKMPDDDPRIETIFPSTADHEPETIFEKGPELQEKTKPPLDDKELFGMTSRERPVDRSLFEDLFGASDDSSKMQKKTLAESKVEKNKQGKVEYLPFARKSVTPKASITVDQMESFNQEQPVVPDNTKLQPTNTKKKSKVKQKQPLGKQERSSRDYLRVAGNIVTALMLIIMVSLSFFLIQSRISGGSPTIAGYQIYVVLSGSMSPAFDTGSIVFVKPTEPTGIVEGDIITFSNSGDATRLTTHRVVGLNWDNGLSFITRGDANNINDPNPVPAENLVGRVTGSVPYVGYLFGFAQTRQGLILLIFIPGLLLIALEMRRLFKYMVDAKVEKLSRRAPADQDSQSLPPSPQVAEDKPTLPNSLRESSLKDFGF